MVAEILENIGKTQKSAYSHLLAAHNKTREKEEIRKKLSFKTKLRENVNEPGLDVFENKMINHPQFFLSKISEKLPSERRPNVGTTNSKRTRAYDHKVMTRFFG